jgi:hypothetical protein
MKILKTNTWLSLLILPTASFLFWLLFVPRTIAIYEPSIKVEIPKELKTIGWCETRNKHWQRNDTGVFEVVRGVVDPEDTGRYQINSRYHGAEAKRMNLDLSNEQDNETFALHLYKRNGPGPWVWSYDRKTGKCKNANELDRPVY